ncbi:hypothetical protein EJ04DRAFT_5691 [Polyplosphaeria fusca]|uniref:Uncharacterized protein n=1 Tax=Polyplosphaeria fusca TaxID=682080 RepID=A0A9P4RD68_9PLEO|nr:hypothetical protein EJ04DRAFT_5691 [Polyplosphaeria fusca]
MGLFVFNFQRAAESGDTTPHGVLFRHGGDSTLPLQFPSSSPPSPHPRFRQVLDPPPVARSPARPETQSLPHQHLHSSRILPSPVP